MEPIFNDTPRMGLKWDLNHLKPDVPFAFLALFGL
jgi:hypothetical protein